MSWPKPYPRVVRAATILAVSVVLAACGSGDITAPNTKDNATLIQQFATLSAQATADSESALSAEYEGIMQTLDMGAPVNQIDVDIDGHPERFSALATVWYAHHSASGASDSTVVLQAWHGANSDTVVIMQLYSDASLSIGLYGALAEVALTIGPTVWESTPDTATVEARETQISGTCATVSSPVQVSIPTVSGCVNDQLTLSFDTNLHSTIGPPGTPHQVSLDHDVLNGIRPEFAEP